MLEWLTEWLAGNAADDLVPSQFGFNVPIPLAGCIALILGAGVFAAWWYWPRSANLATGRRVAVVTMRTLVVLIAVFLALDPAVIAQHVRAGEHFVALLFDDSLSMRIHVDEDRTRGESLQEAYAASKETFEDRLKARHQVLRYRIGEQAEPLGSVEDLSFAQRESRLTEAVDQVIQDLEGTVVSAVVVFSDGVEMMGDEAARVETTNDDVPVFTVGVGAPTSGDASAIWSDIEITDLNLKRTDFDQSPVVLTVKVQSVGLPGREAVVEAAVGSRIVKSKRISIADAVQTHEVRLEFVPDRKDWIEYEARVRLEPATSEAVVPQLDDRIEENNVRHFVVDNREKIYRILYVSGRPNWQNKFFRMSLEADEDQLQLASLIAISNAEQKFEFRGRKSTLANPLFEGFEEDIDRPRYDETVFLRLGTEKDELVSGYPKLPDELFVYDLVIFGDVERPFFTTDQLELTRDFVDTRGGTLLMLGGPRTFTRGGYAGTVIEKMLPVLLYEEDTDPDRISVDVEYQVRPTVEGRLAGSWMLDQDEEADASLWMSLPPLYSFDRFPLVRAGATVLAAAVSSDTTLENAPLFVTQRYGEGLVAALATGDTWQWQMQTEHTDDRHARLWRQVVRNLVSDVPEATYWRGKSDAYAQEAEATFEFVVRDESFTRREALQCSVNVTMPNGRVETLPVDESLAETGVYRVPFTPEVPGLYKVALRAEDSESEQVGALDEAFLVQPDHREFRTAQYDPVFLRELAKSRGGRFFELSALDSVAEEIPVPTVLDADRILLHLWHLPGFYIALVIMLIAEWYLRRTAGEA